MDNLPSNIRFLSHKERDLPKSVQDFLTRLLPWLEATVYRETALRVNHLLGYQVEDTWNPGSIAAGGYEARAVTVEGAALGDFAIASFSLDVTDLMLDAHVTAADTVTCVLHNPTAGAIDLASGTVRVRVLPL